MIRKIASVAALAISTVSMVALTANMAQAIVSRSHQTSSEANKFKLSQAVVDSSNVKVVTHSQGSFKDLGNGYWGETDLQNKALFNFKENARDESSVYLRDQSRDVNIQLDLSRKMIVYSDRSNKFDLYKITQVLRSTQVSIFQQGGYVADFKVSYTTNGARKTIFSKGVTVGRKTYFELPVGSQSIRIDGYLPYATNQKKEFLSESVEDGTCIKTFGTLSPTWNKNCPTADSLLNGVTAVDRKVALQESQLIMSNKGLYTAGFRVSYYHNGAWYIQEDNLVLIGGKSVFTLPTDSEYVIVNGYTYTGLVWDPTKTIFADVNKGLKKVACYQTGGTTLNPSITRINDNEGNVCEPEKARFVVAEPMKVPSYAEYVLNNLKAIAQ
jgi:hypothetical protein